MRKTKISSHSTVDEDVADYDDHYLESLFVGRTKSGLIYLSPDELASKHKIQREPQDRHEEHAHWCATRTGGMDEKPTASTRLCVEPFLRIVLRPAISGNCQDNH